MMHTVMLLVLTINRAYAASAANSTTSNMTAVAVGGACQDTCAAIEAAAQIACVAGIVDEPECSIAVAAAYAACMAGCAADSEVVPLEAARISLQEFATSVSVQTQSQPREADELDIKVGGSCQDTCAAVEAAAQVACVAGIIDEPECSIAVAAAYAACVAGCAADSELAPFELVKVSLSKFLQVAKGHGAKAGGSCQDTCAAIEAAAQVACVAGIVGEPECSIAVAAAYAACVAGCAADSEMVLLEAARISWLEFTKIVSVSRTQPLSEDKALNEQEVEVGGSCQDTCAAVEAAAQVACVAGIVDEPECSIAVAAAYAACVAGCAADSEMVPLEAARISLLGFTASISVAQTRIRPPLEEKALNERNVGVGGSCQDICAAVEAAAQIACVVGIVDEPECSIAVAAAYAACVAGCAAGSEMVPLELVKTSLYKFFQVAQGHDLQVRIGGSCQDTCAAVEAVAQVACVAGIVDEPECSIAVAAAYAACVAGCAADSEMVPLEPMEIFLSKFLDNVRRHAKLQNSLRGTQRDTVSLASAL